MPATIKDIARKLNLSPSTISRALNDHPQINDQTKKKIHDLARELKYKPNLAAAGLRTHKTFCIGLVVPSISNHFFSTILSGIQQVASARGYQLLICQTMEREEEEVKYVDALISSRVDGLLISLSGNGDDSHYDHIKYAMQEMPVVLFDRVSKEIDTPQVEAQDYEGSYKATKHLIKRGCEKIAHLAGTKGLTATQNRMEGYLQALEDHNIEINKELIIYCDWDKEKVPAAIESLLKYSPDIDGVFASNDEMAVHAILELKKRKFSIPGQIAVVGFGNYPIAEIVEPTLTTVKHHPRRIGANSTHLLLSMIDPSYKKWKKEFITSDLIVRESA